MRKKDKDVTTLILLLRGNEYKETAENLEKIIIKKLLSFWKQQKEIQSPFYKFLIFFQIKKTKEKTPISLYIPVEYIISYYIYVITFKKELKRRSESNFQKERR